MYNVDKLFWLEKGGVITSTTERSYKIKFATLEFKAVGKNNSPVEKLQFQGSESAGALKH